MFRVVLASALALASLVALCSSVFAEQPIQTMPASFSVQAVLELTIEDGDGVSGLSFGNMVPGSTTPIEEQGQSSTENRPAVRLTVGSNTNVPWILSASGTDFDTNPPGSSPVGISYLKYKLSAADPNMIAMSNSRAEIRRGAVSNTSVPMFYWLTIPAGVGGGSYSATLTFELTQQ